MTVLIIDGSQGEGGGQMLRSALTLSLITKQPFRLVNVRAGREKPGLLRQHLTALNAAAEISGGKVSGAQVGSMQVTFAPGTVRGGNYRFPIGSAGSAMLVLQTILLPLALAGEASRVEIEGGTHVAWAPPFHFVDQVYLPLLRRMGVSAWAQLQRPGFYPAGGGVVELIVEPAGKLQPLSLKERGAVKRRQAIAMISGLSGDIAQRELAVVKKRLGLDARDLRIEGHRGQETTGNALMLFFETEGGGLELFSALGERGRTSEQVAETACAEAEEWLAADVPVGPHLADQLLLPLALAGSGGFMTTEPTLHTCTNAEVIGKFMEIGFDIEQRGEKQWEVGVR